MKLDHCEYGFYISKTDIFRADERVLEVKRLKSECGSVLVGKFSGNIVRLSLAKELIINAKLFFQFNTWFPMEPLKNTLEILLEVFRLHRNIQILLSTRGGNRRLSSFGAVLFYLHLQVAHFLAQSSEFLL